MLCYEQARKGVREEASMPKNGWNWTGLHRNVLDKLNPKEDEKDDLFCVP